MTIFFFNENIYVVWSVVRAWISCRVQSSFHVPSVTLEWAARASCATAASTECTRNAVGSSSWQRTLITDVHRPASVAQLDAGPTGDKEVAGSTPTEVGNILSWRLIMKYFLRSFSPFPLIQERLFFRGDWSWNIFYGHSLPFADSRRAVVSFWRKNVHNTG